MNLLKELDCNVVAIPPSHRAQIQPWLDRRDMRVLELDSQDSLLADRGVAQVPYSKTFEEAEWDPAAVLHTSGSTGFPKLIVIRVGLLATCDALRKLPNWQGASFSFRAWADISKKQFVPSKFPSATHHK
jgi:acyl-coenzyme A synthetase/AMP-(fatty) acid ligase